MGDSSIIKMPQILSYDVLGSGDLVLCRLPIEIAFPPQHLETQLQEIPPWTPPFCMPLCSSTPV